MDVEFCKPVRIRHSTGDYDSLTFWCEKLWKKQDIREMLEFIADGESTYYVTLGQELVSYVITPKNAKELLEKGETITREYYYCCPEEEGERVKLTLNRVLGNES